MYWRSLLFPTQSLAAQDYLKKTGNYLPFGKVQRLRRLESSTSRGNLPGKTLDLKFAMERTKVMKNVWDFFENFLKEISLPAVELRIYFQPLN